MCIFAVSVVLLSNVMTNKKQPTSIIKVKQAPPFNRKSTGREVFVPARTIIGVKHLKAQPCKKNLEMADFLTDMHADVIVKEDVVS